MKGKKTYNINLDPAVFEVNFPANIDIRDSVKYKNIMKTYKLGKGGNELNSVVVDRTEWSHFDMSQHICSAV